MSCFEIDEILTDFQASTGIDEVGRGCLAGPVVVACVTWDHHAAAQRPWFADLTDSKQMDAARRADLYAPILDQATRVRVAVLSHMVVDLLNILQATLHGFELTAPAYDAEVPLFLDGNQRPRGLPWGRTLIKGDARQSAVAAASVVAKVTRDALMARLHAREPVYGFARHMGYATATHRRAIEAHGPGLYHRKSFAPIKHLCEAARPRDGVWLARVQAAPADTLPALWSAFCRAYPELSLSGARRVMQAFHERGLALLPSCREPAAPS